MLAAALLSVAAASVVLATSNREDLRQWIDLETVPWGAPEQTILHAFPEMLPDRKYGKGWEPGYRCGGPEDPVLPEINCGGDHFDPYLTIVDLGDHESVLRYLASTAITSSPDRPVAHPEFSDPLVGNSRLRVSDTARVYVRFPADSPKSRFLMTISWPGHSESEIYDRWLPRLPIHP